MSQCYSVWVFPLFSSSIFWRLNLLECANVGFRYYIEKSIPIHTYILIVLYDVPYIRLCLDSDRLLFPWYSNIMKINHSKTTQPNIYVHKIR